MNGRFRTTPAARHYAAALLLAAWLAWTGLSAGLPYASTVPAAVKPPLFAPKQPEIESAPYDWVAGHPLIAHALGGIGGYAGTNSREGLEQAYRDGHRIFETDISVTSDGVLVLRHDWEAGTYPVLGQQPPAAADIGPMTLKKFRSLKIQHSYTPMTFKELVRFMAGHPDMLLVTDTKEPAPARAEAVFRKLVAETKEVDERVLRRIVPQLYVRDDLAAVGAVYPFKQYIYTLYMNHDTEQQVIDFVRAVGIRIVVMDESKYSPAFVRKLRENGVAAYINTINEPARIKQLRDAGVQGVMTDFVTPAAYADGKTVQK